MAKAKDHHIDYYQAAEYDTTVKLALDEIGFATPEQYLKHALDQYLVGLGPLKYSPNGDRNGFEYMPSSHPDYTLKEVERRQEIKSQLEQAYKFREQELIDGLVADQARNPPEPQLLLANLLKESAKRLLEQYSDHLTRVRDGRLDQSFRPSVMRIINPRDTSLYARIPKDLVKAGKGAAELAYFKRLLAEFDQGQPVDDTNGDTTADTMLDPIRDPNMKQQRRVALLHVYSQNPIAKRNDIAHQYGWDSPESLYNQYTHLIKTTNRIHSANKEKMIADIEAVLPYLSGRYLEQAKSDLKTIRL